MKNRLRSITLFSLFALPGLVALPQIASADDGVAINRADRKFGDRQEHRAKMLAEHDRNRDGKLDDAERTAMHRDRLDKMFARLDANRDGYISRREFAAGMEKKMKNGKKGWKRHGKRGNGRRGRGRGPA